MSALSRGDFALQSEREKCLHRIAEKALSFLGIGNATITITFLRQREMRRLEHLFLKSQNKRVDVLSFPEPKHFPHPEASKKLLGEVYLNWDACKGNVTYASTLLVHSLLHLLGYRHDRKNDIITMEKLEKRLASAVTKR